MEGKEEDFLQFHIYLPIHNDLRWSGAAIGTLTTFQERPGRIF